MQKFTYTTNITSLNDIFTKSTFDNIKNCEAHYKIEKSIFPLFMYRYNDNYNIPLFIYISKENSSLDFHYQEDGLKADIKQLEKVFNYPDDDIINKTISEVNQSYVNFIDHFMSLKQKMNEQLSADIEETSETNLSNDTTPIVQLLIHKQIKILMGIVLTDDTNADLYTPKDMLGVDMEHICTLDPSDIGIYAYYHYYFSEKTYELKIIVEND